MRAASIELAGGTGGGAAAAAACDPGHWPLARDREPRLRQPPCCPFLFHSIKCGLWTKRHHSGEPFLGRLQSEWERACAAAGVPPVGRLYGIRRSPCSAPQWRRSSATSATSV